MVKEPAFHTFSTSLIMGVPFFVWLYHISSVDNDNKNLNEVQDRRRPYKCLACDASFFSKCSVKRHNVIKHERKKPYKCGFCNLSFTTNTNLKRHVFVVHEGNKPFVCQSCNQSFSLKCNLKSHIFVCMKEKNLLNAKHVI